MVNREIFTKQFTGLVLANMFFWMSTNIFMPVLPLYYHGLGMNDHQVGAAVGAFSVGAILFRVFSGKAVDRYGGARIIAGGIVLSVAAIASYGFSQSLVAASISRFLHGVGISFYSAAALTTASLILSEKHTTEALATFTLFAMFGVGIANSSALFLYQTGGLPFVLAVGVASTLLALALYPKNPTINVRAEASATLPIADVVRHPSVFIPTISLLAVHLCFGSAMTFVPLLMLSRNISELSPFYIAYAVTVIGSRFWVSKLCLKFTPQKVAFGILLLFGCSMLVVAFAPSTIALILCGAGIGISYGLAFPALASIITANTQPANRGTAFGFFTSAIDVGFGLGSIGMGFVANAWGYSAIFLVAGAYVLVYAVFFRTVLWSSLGQIDVRQQRGENR